MTKDIKSNLRGYVQLFYSKSDKEAQGTEGAVNVVKCHYMWVCKETFQTQESKAVYVLYVGVYVYVRTMLSALVSMVTFFFVLVENYRRTVCQKMGMWCPHFPGRRVVRAGTNHEVWFDNMAG